MEILTQRLALKEVYERDLEHIHALHSIPAVDRYNTLGMPEDLSVTRKIVQDWLQEQQATPRMHYVFSIVEAASGRFAGMAGLRLGKLHYRIAEVWYKLHPDFWGHGYATEVLKALLHLGFEDLDLHRIEAGCAVENIASIKVLEKAGMLREAHKRKLLPIRGEWVDNYGYAILEEDYRKGVERRV